MSSTKSRNRRKSPPPATAGSKPRVEPKVTRFSITDCYETGYNLTPEQLRWRQANQLLKPILDGQQEPSYMSLAFRANDRHPRSNPLGLHQVRRICEVLVSTCSFIPRAKWHRRCHSLYRLNWLDHYVRADGPNGVGDDGDLYVSTSQVAGDAKRPDPRQRDLFNAPLSPMQDFELRRFVKGRTLDYEGEWLSAPCAGEFSVQVTSQHINLCLNGATIYRFMLYDRGALHLHEQMPNDLAKPGRVSAGTVLACVLRDCEYAKARGRFEKEPVVDWLQHPPGDRFVSYEVAPRSLDTFRVAIRQMEQLALAESNQFDKLVPVELDNCLPDYLLEMDERKLLMLPRHADWTYTVALQDALVQALRPDSENPLFVPTRCGTETTFESQREVPESGSRVIRYQNGVEQIVPLSVTLLDSVLKGAVLRPDDPLGYWLACGEQLWSLDWAYLSTLPYLAAVTAEFLRQRLLHQGSRGYFGTRTLVPARFIPQPLRASATDRYLDFQDMSAQYDPDTQAFYSPPLLQQNWDDLVREQHDVVYDATPVP